MRFNGADAFARFMSNAFAHGIHEHVLKHQAERAGETIRDEAKRVLGTYDYGWQPLKMETVARKAHGDTPLLETGKMRDSIAYTIQPIAIGYKITVGSPDPNARFHEFGTSKMPPRPFLSGAITRKMPEVVTHLGHSIRAHLTER